MTEEKLAQQRAYMSRVLEHLRAEASVQSIIQRSEEQVRSLEAQASSGQAVQAWSTFNELWHCTYSELIKLATEVKYVVGKRRTKRAVKSILRKAFKASRHYIGRCLRKVCSGLIKLGAAPGGVKPNFLTDFLFPDARNDKLHA
ncbi:MAG: hypothetical protein JWO08_1694 [Verrucomicrobiaceae bacterium]|nr:hypothetical protein [Verrucomicrobiaceae bacterium]